MASVGEKHPPGGLAMFVATMVFAVANFRRLLLWALPVPLYTLAIAFLTGGEGLLPSEDDVGFDDFPDPELGESDEADLDLPSISPLHALANFLGLLLGIPLQFGIQRHLLLDSPLGRPAYFRMFASRLVWRYAVLVIGLWLAFMAILVVNLAIFISLLTSLIDDDLSVELFVLTSWMGLLPGLGLAVFFILKLSLAPPLLARGEPHPLRRSWAATKGGLLRLLVAYLLTLLVTMLLINLASALLRGLAEQQILAPLFLALAVLSFFSMVTLSVVPCQFLRATETKPPSCIESSGNSGDPQ